MIGSFRQSMTWLHTWAGLVFCWVLYFMFVTGTLGYFDTEIDRWMQPEQPRAADVSTEQNLSVAVSYAEAEAPDADRWFIGLPGGRNETQLRVFWQGPAPEDSDEETPNGNVELDAHTGEPLPESQRATGGGQLLYRMHYVFHYIDPQVGFRIAGIFTLFMFVGMITGIVVHKKIFKDFFTFRPAKGKRSWLDMHNLLSVSSLPFQLMITYSGLIFTVALWMPMIAFSSYGFNAEETQKALGGFLDREVERSGEAAELVNFDVIVADATAAWGEGHVRGFDVRAPGDVNAEVFVNRSAGVNAIGESRRYDGVSGEYLETIGSPNAPISVAGVFVGLHEGLFAGPVLRWLYFFWGLLGAAMVATGAIYWTAKRRRDVPDHEQARGFRFVECLNIGTIVGLPVAIAAYFLANRLLPLGFEGRADWEVHTMFIAWAVCLLYPLLRPRVAAWRELSWAAAAACFAIPIVNAATTDAHLLNTVPAGDWVLASFDLASFAFAITFAVLASRIGRTPRASVSDVSAEPVGEVAIS
ncbi:MAG: PepSY-associated TM helix domain-containing protein [Pseudomonadota bacterium]